MANVLKDLTPKKFFDSFEAISAIPRKSLDEKRIADFLVEYASARGLFCIRDEANNVFVRVPATKGRENDPAILIQGHTDMVCEKNDGVEHDFDTDGLDLYIDGDFIKARGTTLGADDGVAVAMMMAVMDGEFESHPTVECLFTSAEEIGLIGAGAFDYTNVTARRLLNLDSAEEGCVTVGCAGGVRSCAVFEGERTPFDGECVSITVKGLLGGHSGEDINRGRHSANVVLMRYLRALCLKEDIRIASIAGGGKDNAISREATVTVVVSDADAVIAKVNALAAAMRTELAKCDEGMTVTAVKAEADAAYSADFTRRLIGACTAVTTGVIKMSAQIEGLVEFSRNLGSFKMIDCGVEVVWSTRSPSEAQLDAGEEEITLTASLCGAASVKHYHRYPGWSYPGSSALCDSFCKHLRDVAGIEPTRIILHAGLECGLIKAAIPDMDIISAGPDEIDIHSPDERLGIPSTQRLCEVVRRILAE